MIFGKPFILSYLKHNSDKCRYIFILDTGLTESDKKWLEQFDQVHIIGSNVSTSFKNGHSSPEWTQTVCAKTIGLRRILDGYDNITPLIMVDSDCLFLGDIDSIIDTSKDIQICFRGHNHITPMLGSYVSFNQKCLDFLDRWIEVIPTITTPWKESPALRNLYHEYLNKLDIGLIDFNVVSCFEKNKINNETKILHFKSSKKASTIEESYKHRVIDRGFLNFVNEYNNG